MSGIDKGIVRAGGESPDGGPGTRPPPPSPKTMDEACFWIDILWKWACEDIRRIRLLEDRVAAAERPWWRRW